MVSKEELEAIELSAQQATSRLMEQGADAVIVIVATSTGDGLHRTYRSYKGSPFAVLGMLHFQGAALLRDDQEEQRSE